MSSLSPRASPRIAAMNRTAAVEASGGAANPLELSMQSGDGEGDEQEADAVPQTKAALVADLIAKIKKMTDEELEAEAASKKRNSIGGRHAIFTDK